MMNLHKILGLLFIMTIFASCNNKKISQTTYDELMRILSSSVASEQERFESHMYRLEAEFIDPIRSRYIPILDVIKLVELKGAEFDNLKKQLLIEMGNEKNISIASKIKLLDSLQNFIVRRDDFLMNRFEKMLHENKENFELIGDELNERLESAKKDFNAETQKILNINQEIKDDDIFQLKLLMIEKIALGRQWFFGTHFLSLVKTSCGWDTFFPVIQPKTGCVNKGDYFEAILGVGEYSANLNPLRTKIVVNGDTLKMDQSGTAPYKIKAQKRGEVVLHLECEIFNPLTGVITKGQSEYIYTVN